MNYSFPIAFLFNTSSVTFLLIALGLLGKSEMAAEVAIIQASTLALFFAFSANARNVILSEKSSLGAHDLLRVRMFLVIPLAVAAFYLVDYVIEVNILLAIFIIIRRALDWITEIELSEMERSGDQSHVHRYLVVQLGVLIIALAWLLFGTKYPLAGIFAWCLSPALAFRIIRRNTEARYTSISNLRDLLLPHMGSTAVLGISVYVFRILIVLMVGKAIAGDLFTAFSIGGVIGSGFAYSIGPSIALREQKGEGEGLPWVVKALVSMTVIGGIAFVILALNDINIFYLIGKSSGFLLAVGLSLIGGAIFVAAQVLRLRIIQLGRDANVFGADVLMNIILIAVIPYAYNLLGSESLAYLYLFGAILAYVFYQTFDYGIGATAGVMTRKYARALIAFLLLMPVFFMLDGTIFADTSMSYGSQENIIALPLPVSILACFIGIILMGRYRLAHLSLTVIFITFVLMTISVLLSSPDMNSNTQEKFKLLVQFILPYFALVLGQTFEEKWGEQVIEKSFLIVLLLIIPAQVILTIIYTFPVLTPSVGLFSIYQHLEYAPVIFVSAYLLVFFSLYRHKHYSAPLLILTALMIIYVGASFSNLTFALFTGGIALFIAYSWGDIKKKWLMVLLGVVIVILPLTYMYAYKSTVSSSEKYIVSGDMDRSEHWRTYAGGIGESNSTLLFGQPGRPDRSEYPGAHNYYLEFIYHFGIIAILPFIYLCIHTIRRIYKNRKYIICHPVLGLSYVTLFLFLIDSLFNTGFKQLYPGIYMFFLWGILLSRLCIMQNITKKSSSEINIKI